VRIGIVDSRKFSWRRAFFFLVLDVCPSPRLGPISALSRATAEDKGRRIDEQGRERERQRQNTGPGQGRGWEARHATSSRLAGCGGAGWAAGAGSSRSSISAAAACGAAGDSCGGGSVARRAGSPRSTWRRCPAHRAQRGSAWSPASPRRSWPAPGGENLFLRARRCRHSPSLGPRWRRAATTDTNPRACRHRTGRGVVLVRQQWGSNSFGAAAVGIG
jgi:hypothetical protein